MSSIYLRGKTYWIKYYIDKVCYRESLKTRDKATAKYLCSCKEKELAEGKRPVGLKEITIKEALEEYIKESQIRKTLKTHKENLLVLNKFFSFFPHIHIVLKSITQKDINNFLLKRIQDDRISPVTANNYLKVINVFFNWAVAQKYIASNPASDIKKFKVEQNPPKFLTKEEVKKLLSVAKKENNNIYLIILIALYTGCRKGELLNLEWQDIDIKKNILTIRNKENFKTKSKRFRTIPIHKELKKELLKHGNKEGKCFNQTNIRKRLTRVFKNAELKGAGLHHLRHTFASYLASSGTSLHIISKLLGHADSITTQIYAHLLPSSLDNAMEKLTF